MINAEQKQLTLTELAEQLQEWNLPDDEQVMIVPWSNRADNVQASITVDELRNIVHLALIGQYFWTEVEPASPCLTLRRRLR